MTRRWEVQYHHEFDDGTTGGGDPPTQHRSWLGAEWYRRFRYHHFGMGSCWVQTEVVPLRGQSGWPYYATIFRAVWPVFYFLRSRWDGLRYGRNRDARS